MQHFGQFQAYIKISILAQIYEFSVAKLYKHFHQKIIKLIANKKEVHEIVTDISSVALAFLFGTFTIIS